MIFEANGGVAELVDAHSRLGGGSCNNGIGLAKALHENSYLSTMQGDYTSKRLQQGSKVWGYSLLPLVKSLPPPLIPEIIHYSL